MADGDVRKRLRRIKVLEDFAAKSFLGDKEKPKDREDFYEKCPLDSVIRTPEGNVAYGYINEETASIVKGKQAPVIVTEEVYHHLISKQEKRDIEDMRIAVQEAMAHPTAIGDGNGNGSFNIYFQHNGKDNQTTSMYINLNYCETPVSCYTVRSIVPAFKMRGEIFVQGQDIPSLLDIPEGISNLEAKITNSYGDRITGMTWNKGNLLKALRLYSEENELPSSNEMEEIKKWLAQGDKEWMQKHFGLYIKQALEQTHCDKFFQIAKESGVLATIAPELDKVVTPEFLNTLQRTNGKSPKFKQSMILAELAKQSEDKSAAVDTMSAKYSLQEGKDEAKSFALYSNRLLKAGKSDVEILWSTIENITNNFKKPELLNAVSEMCEVQLPDICSTSEFREKIALCKTICERAPELKMAIAATMKAMPKEVTREERIQAQENTKKNFMQVLVKEIQSRKGNTPIISGGRNG